MIEMIPLVQCDRADASRYYRETLVFLNNEPCMFLEKDNKMAVVQNATGDTVNCKYADLRTCILEPFYAQHTGEYVGHQAGRRTSRGIHYPRSQYGDIVAMITHGDVPACQYKDGYRINKDFRTIVRKQVTYLLYRNEHVGIFEDDTFYVSDIFIKERLEKLYGNTPISVRVIESA